MRPPVEIFDEWLKGSRLGRRFHPIPLEIHLPFRDQLDVFNRRMEIIRRQFLPDRGVDIYLDFIDDGTCNAVASLHENIGMIGLNKGLVLLPLDLFWRMFSHPAFLPDVGDRHLERRSAQHGDDLPTDYDHLVEQRKRANRSIHVKPPICRVRSAIAQVCMDLVWRFIAMHEIVHIVHGHCDYVRRRHGLPFILSGSGPIVSAPMSRANVDRQTIEVWADLLAAQVVLRGFLNESPTVGITGLSDVRDKLFVWSLSMFTLYRLWGLSIDLTDLQTGLYPPTALRFAFVMTGVSYDAATAFPQIGDADYVRIVRGGQIAAETGIAYCGGERLRPADVGPLLDPAVKRHTDLLYEHFDNVLYPELTKYARVAIRRTSDPQPQPPRQTLPSKEPSP